ncbi:MAG: hypothetical protein IKC48_04745 [Clostridia bacterium]|nr:hypothetical protein [Clostridia bacterium]
MPKVVGVKFSNTAKIYYFEPREHEYTQDCGVIVETARGIEYGTVALLPMDISEDKIVGQLKPIIRVATPKDTAQYKELEARRVETMTIAHEKIKASGLDMKLVDAKYNFDGQKLVLYFTADERVDFRELVRELASTFHTRIELRQIGARDECKMLGGIGPCGRPCCCAAHALDYAHVSIKMAKNQGLALNPGKINGLCGSLMCCLEYENDYYTEVNKLMPKVGSEVSLADGAKGVVTAINQLKKTVTVKTQNKDDSFTYSTVTLDELNAYKENEVEKEAEATQTEVEDERQDQAEVEIEVSDKQAADQTEAVASQAEQQERPERPERKDSRGKGDHRHGREGGKRDYAKRPAREGKPQGTGENLDKGKSRHHGNGNRYGKKRGDRSEKAPQGKPEQN